MKIRTRAAGGWFDGGLAGESACPTLALVRTPAGEPLPDGGGSHGRNERGSGLLAVLCLSAALAAIAFSLSVTVRGEIERTSTEVDGLRCAYLASAGIERAAMELLWSATSTENKLIPKGSTFVNYVFPSGNVRVEIIPETAKIGR